MKRRSLSVTELVAPRGSRARWATMALTVLFTACATARSGNPFGGGVAGGGQHIRVYVQNLGLSDVHVYALTAGRTRDLGTVQTTQTRTFSLPWNEMAPLSFRLDFQTDGQYATRTVGASPGNTVELDIPANGGSATVQIR